MSREIKIVVTTPIEEGSVRKIEAVDERISVDQVSPLVYAEKKAGGAEDAQLTQRLGRAEILYGWIHQFPRNLRERASGLKWMQVMSAGVDRLPDKILQSPVRIVTTSGLHGAAMGEVVLEMMLMFAKDAPACLQMKQARQWKRYRPKLLKGQTAGVLGLGHIGREVARLCAAFGMRVVGLRRSAEAGDAVPGVERVYGPGQLARLLAESDFVVLALPLTGETRGMIGEQELRAMKPSAFLINVARGAITDEAALIRALEEKRIAGAGLDVFVEEPLPPESRFYELPGVIFSPHISGEMPDYEAQATEIFCANLRRYLAGEPFLHEVDKTKGY